MFIAGATPTRLVNIRKDRAEARDLCRNITIGAWQEELTFGDVATDWRE